jgi:hypothetical protein
VVYYRPAPVYYSTYYAPTYPVYSRSYAYANTYYRSRPYDGGYSRYSYDRDDRPYRDSYRDTYRNSYRDSDRDGGHRSYGGSFYYRGRDRDRDRD